MLENLDLGPNAKAWVALIVGGLVAVAEAVVAVAPLPEPWSTVAHVVIAVGGLLGLRKAVWTVPNVDVPKA